MAGSGVLRIANCSGFYGDRLSAAREMVEGGPIDVLTGDWLAELTMLLLGKAMLGGRPGYARTFLTQLEQVLPACVERGIKIVTNAGGLDPAGCASAVAEIARRAGVSPVIAHVTGDDLLPRLPGLLALGHPLANLDTGQSLASADVNPLTAHAYLGGLPIAAALSAGADIVITGRVTDAALVVGPGMWRFGWTGDDLDALAGAVVTGHVLECGCQATGGNYSFFDEVPDLAHAGFPLAELALDGSAVITKHPGTGGLVSVGTITAQLLYEIGSPSYLNPDVTARFDTVRLEQAGPDRVLISGARGEPPPPSLKVSLNYAGGYRNSMVLVLEGLNPTEKAELAEQAIWARIDGGRASFETVDVEVVGSDPALLRISVLDQDKAKVGRAFSAAVVETALASYPGFYALSPPGDASAYGVFWPASLPADLVSTTVTIDSEPVWTGPARATPTHPHPEPGHPEPGHPEPGHPEPGHPEPGHPEPGHPEPGHPEPGHPGPQAESGHPAPGHPRPQPEPGHPGPGHPGPGQPGPGKPAPGQPPPPAQVREMGVHGAEMRWEADREAGEDGVGESIVRLPLGAIAGARSGDKGGNANLGVWVRTEAEFDWLDRYLTETRLAELLPSVAGLRIERYALPNLLALNFVINGLLGRGVAASTRLDPQAKALGEELRAAIADVPERLSRSRSASRKQTHSK